MALDDRQRRLRERAARALGTHRVAEAVAKVRAIVGPAHIPDSEVLAQAALDKLHRGEVPTVGELTALEIVVRLLRPVVLVRQGALLDLPDLAGHNLYPADLKDAWSGFRTAVQAVLPSIGRIETGAGGHVGTGFVVADGLIATNRHVLGQLTFGAEVLARGAARIVLRQEADAVNTTADIVPITGVAAVHPTLDMALLTTPVLGRPPLAFAPAPAAEAARVVTVGFPADDPANNPLFLSGVFGGRFGVKRAAIGEVLDGAAPPDLFHDCSTTRGNSGSPVFALDSGAVVAIHRAGYFMYRNEAIDVAALARFVDTARP